MCWTWWSVVWLMVNGLVLIGCLRQKFIDGWNWMELVGCTANRAAVASGSLGLHTSHVPLHMWHGTSVSTVFLWKIWKPCSVPVSRSSRASWNMVQSPSKPNENRMDAPNRAFIVDWPVLREIISGISDTKLKLSVARRENGQDISLGPDDSHDQNSACEYIGALPRIRCDKVQLVLRTDDNDQVTAKANLELLLLRHSLSTEVPDERDRIGMLSTTPRSKSHVGFEIAKTQMHDNEANQGSQPKGRFSDVSKTSSASDSSASMLNPGEKLADNIECQCQDFVFGTLPRELSLQLLQCLTVSDVCLLRASCKKVGAPHVLVDHFAYLVDPARPDVYPSVAGVIQATDKQQFRQNLSREMQPRIQAYWLVVPDRAPSVLVANQLSSDI